MSGSPARTARAPAARPSGAVLAGPPRMGWKAAFFVLALAAIAGGVAWALLGSRLLVVRSVQVTGTGNGSEVSRTQVLAAAQIPRGLPLIRVNTSAAARRVGRLHDVQSAQVSRAWPDAIVISVRLRSPVFMVAVPGGYEVVDAFGVEMRFSAHRPAGYPLLTVGSAASAPWPGQAVGGSGGAARNPGGSGRPGSTHQSGHQSSPGHQPGKKQSGHTHQPGQAQPGQTHQPSKTSDAGGPGVPGAGSSAGAPLRGNPAVRAAATVLRELPPAIAHRVRAVHAPNASDVSVRLADGVVIVWGDTSRAGEKAKELALLMRTDARGYDVSAPGTAVTQG
jgi:cell division septal protein FtsQ